MPRSKISNTKKTNAQSLKQLVAKAKKTIVDAERPLPIDGDPIPPAEARSLRAVAIISADALSAAADVLDTHGSMFPTFSASEASDAHAYEVAMRDLSATLKAFARRIDRSVLRRRVVPINNTLALYAAVKAVGRTDEQLDETTRRLGKLIAVGRRRSSTPAKNAVTKKPDATQAAPPSPPATKIAGTTPIIVSIDSGATIAGAASNGAAPPSTSAASQAAPSH